MTTTLDDEMGWTKKDTYCSSSSEDEGEQAESSTDNCPRKYSSGQSCNTGPKGVLEDWRQFRTLESERRIQREQELVALAKRVSLTCRSHRDDELAAKEEQAIPEKVDDDDDEFLNEYAAKRMREMMNMYQTKQSPQFGTVYELPDADAFLIAIDEDSKSATVVLHLYDTKVKCCELLDQCLVQLAARYTMVKFCRVRAALVGASKRLQTVGLPAVLAYRGGQLIGNFVRIDDELDKDFDIDNIEQYLREYSILPDMGNCSNIRAGNSNKPTNALDSDSD